MFFPILAKSKRNLKLNFSLLNNVDIVRSS